MSNSRARHSIFNTDRMINERQGIAGIAKLAGIAKIGNPPRVTSILNAVAGNPQGSTGASRTMPAKHSSEKNNGTHFFLKVGLLIAGPLLISTVHAQRPQEPGKVIGKVSTEGNLIVMELDEGVLGKTNLFDLVGRTLRFIPDGSEYRVENVAMQWDKEFGNELRGPQVALHNFNFPYSGKEWDAFSVGTNGSIRFGSAPERPGVDLSGENEGRSGGVSIGRFDQLTQAARSLINRVPAICVFLKPRLFGTRYVKEEVDRVVITWDVSEPVGGIQDFTWVKTVNRFQAVLRRDGVIEMSYDQVAAKDAIVGVYPVVDQGKEKLLATLPGQRSLSIAPHLDIQRIKVGVTDSLFLNITIETRGPVLAEGDAGLPGIAYRVIFNTNRVDVHNPALQRLGSREVGSKTDLVWTVRGVGGQGRGSREGVRPRYVAIGPGVVPEVKASGNTISIRGVLPPAFQVTDHLAVSAEAETPGNPPVTVDRVPPREIKLSGIRSPEMHLSSLTRKDGPFTIAYESFHYLALPNPRDMACTVIKALGDRFDFLAYYSDFRVDNQEAGTPSNGPLGGNVTGIGASATQRGLESYCSNGKFQWQFVQPVYAGSNQMQERPPDGITGSRRDITFYARQLGERSPDGKMLGYNLAMSQIGHEMGHRWAAFVSAKVNGETVPLGPTHWARGLQAQAAFPYQRPVEASAMGGGVWEDNFDGTYTQLDDDYYVPATGWSYLDLYLMGLISVAEVPDFFLLKNLVPAGSDSNGHPVFKADRVKITVQDVIAVEGPRLPAVDQSQKNFNTGIVLVVEHGNKPSHELIERANGIRERWIDYWATTTGHRSSMTVNPQAVAGAVQGNKEVSSPAGSSK
jgi:hypothetical protein